MTAQQTSQVTSPCSRNETGAPENKVYVMLANFSEESRTILKSTIIGVAEQISEPWVNQVNAGEPTQKASDYRK